MGNKDSPIWRSLPLAVLAQRLFQQSDVCSGFSKEQMKSYLVQQHYLRPTYCWARPTIVGQLHSTAKGVVDCLVYLLQRHPDAESDNAMVDYHTPCTHGYRISDNENCGPQTEAKEGIPVTTAPLVDKDSADSFHMEDRAFGPGRASNMLLGPSCQHPRGVRPCSKYHDGQLHQAQRFPVHISQPVWQRSCEPK